MKSIFLSHVDEDSTIGLQLADELEKKGYTVWCYERDCIAGVSYLITTREAINECKVLVILISDNSIKSRQIDVELEHAHEEVRPIIPVCLGVTDAYYKGKKPSWAQMIGTGTSTPISKETVSDAAQRLCTGFRKIGIRPLDEQPPEKKIDSPLDSELTECLEEHKNEKVPPRPIKRSKTMVCILESAIFVAILAVLLLIWQTKNSTNPVAFTVSPPMNTIQTFNEEGNALTVSCDERNCFLLIYLPDRGYYSLGIRVPTDCAGGLKLDVDDKHLKLIGGKPHSEAPDYFLLETGIYDIEPAIDASSLRLQFFQLGDAKIEIVFYENSKEGGN